MAVYDQNIVIDLEFTPVSKDADVWPLRDEVIQIGAVRIAHDGTLVDEFSCFVKPDFCINVSRFVRKLTGITWSQLGEAPSFAEALASLSEWIGDGKSRIVAWSDSDFKQLAVECAVKGVPFPKNMGRWMDLQRVFPYAMKLGRKGRRMSLHQAFAWYEKELTSSSEHQALLDAKHTAKLFVSLLRGEHIEQRKVLASVMRPVGSHDAVSVAAGGMGTDGKFGVGSVVGGCLTSNPMAGALASLYSQMTGESAGNVAVATPAA